MLCIIVILTTEMIPYRTTGPVEIERPILDLGRGRGGVFETSIVLHNTSSAPVKLIGGTSDCSCVTSQGLPAVLAPNERITLPIAVQFKCESSGQITRTALILTDNPTIPQVRFRIVYQCTSSPN